MTAPAARMDGWDAGRLAALDPALALLPEALPAESRWRPDDVRWRPGLGCRAAYRVQRPRAAATFVGLEVTGSGWRAQDYREDPAIPGLRLAADPGWVSGRLATVLGEPVRDCRVDPVRYRPGSRCVLRYVVGTDSGTRTVYAKLFRDHRSADLQLSTSSRAGGRDGRLVPEMWAAWPDVRAVVAPEVPGTAVSTALEDPDLPTPERVELARRLGQLLARFHRITGVPAPTWSAADQLALVSRSVDAMACADTALADRTAALLDVLAARLPAPSTQVLAHGGFRPGQVVWTGTAMVVLDTEGVSRCDAGRDLGTALAHLRWQAVRHPEHQRALGAAERALVSGYEAQAGGVDRDVLAWWHALSLLQVAARRYRRLETADWPRVPRLVDRAADVLLGGRFRTAADDGLDLMDLRRMSTVLSFGISAARSAPALRVDRAERVSTAPGRAVVSYLVHGLDFGGPAPVIGKSFAEPRRAALLHHHLQLLHDGPFGAGPQQVPEPLGFVPGHRLVLYRRCFGTPLDLIGDSALVADGVRRAARWLARLHGSRVLLPRRFCLESEEDSTRQWAQSVARRHPDLGGSADLLAGGWAAAARAARRADGVPIHKDFQPGHVLIGEQTCVIDLDEARMGDPALDVAHFRAYLEVVFEDPAMSRLPDLFVDEYAVASGWSDPEGLALFGAYAWLKIAKQCAAGSGPFRDRSPERNAATVGWALRKGRRCVNA